MSLTCLCPCILTSLYPKVRLLIFSHLDILISLSLCLCVLACILASLHPHILMFMRPYLQPCILISLVSCVLACNLISSHTLILRPMCSMCLLVSLQTNILISLASYTLSACWYFRILTSSYSQHISFFD